MQEVDALPSTKAHAFIHIGNINVYNINYIIIIYSRLQTYTLCMSIHTINYAYAVIEIRKPKTMLRQIVKTKCIICAILSCQVF